MNDVLKLISVTKTQDAYGIWQKTRSYHQVFCDVRSISRTEFFEGGRNGLNPEYQFTVFAGDYDGERLIEYAGNTYAVYRTYLAGSDYIELYAQREGGANGKAESNSGNTGNNDQGNP